MQVIGYYLSKAHARIIIISSTLPSSASLITKSSILKKKKKSCLTKFAIKLLRPELADWRASVLFFQNTMLKHNGKKVHIFLKKKKINQMMCTKSFIKM